MPAAITPSAFTLRARARVTGSKLPSRRPANRVHRGGSSHVGTSPECTRLITARCDLRAPGIKCAVFTPARRETTALLPAQCVGTFLVARGWSRAGRERLLLRLILMGAASR